MTINFDDLGDLDNLSGTLRIIVTDKPIPANTKYLTWEHRMSVNGFMNMKSTEFIGL